MDAYIGEIRMFAGDFAPKDWAFCNGQLLPITSNTALYSLLGTTYGGDGKNTFALPNMQGRTPMHAGSGNGLTPRQIGTAPGVATVALTVQQIPAHTHGVAVRNTSATDSTPSPASTWAVTKGRPGGPVYAAAAPDAPMNPSTLTPAGGSQPHNNRQPYTAIHFIICLRGLYPPRS